MHFLPYAPDGAWPSLPLSSETRHLTGYWFFVLSFIYFCLWTPVIKMQQLTVLHTLMQINYNMLLDSASVG